MNSNETIELLISTSDALERRLDRGLSFLRGISYREYRLLKCVQQSPQQKLTRVDLAAAVGLTPSAVTRALKPLEKMGYVTTERGIRDARQNLAVLTEGGQVLLQDTDAAVNDIVEQLPIATWSNSKRGALVELLQAMRDSS
jgi:DNA-binding MarR family transcriptional regulator